MRGRVSSCRSHTLPHLPPWPGNATKKEAQTNAVMLADTTSQYHSQSHIKNNHHEHHIRCMLCGERLRTQNETAGIKTAHNYLPKSINTTNNTVTCKHAQNIVSVTGFAFSVFKICFGMLAKDCAMNYLCLYVICITYHNQYPNIKHCSYLQTVDPGDIFCNILHQLSFCFLLI